MLGELRGFWANAREVWEAVTHWYRVAQSPLGFARQIAVNGAAWAFGISLLGIMVVGRRMVRWALICGLVVLVLSVIARG
jgi:hypothetical protein